MSLVRVGRRRSFGLGQGDRSITFDLPTTLPPILQESIDRDITNALNAPPSASLAQSIANNLLAAGSVTGTEARLFLNLTPAQQQQYLRQGQGVSSTGFDISSWLNAEPIAGIKNAYLAGGIALIALVAAIKKKR